MKKGHLLINEMFASVQGEGMYVGTPMLFIRTSGCNLRCVWCDQPDSVAEGFQGQQLKGQPVHVDSIMDWVDHQESRYHHVCLTGGEPTVHHLGDLVQRINMSHRVVHVETNGTHCPDWLYACGHVCLSPKLGADVHPTVWALAHEVKYIVDDEFEAKHLEAAFTRVPAYVPIYLQPANHLNTLNPVNVQKAQRLLQTDYRRLRLSVQLHKVLGVH